MDFPGLLDPVIFLHGGWGKVSAAASTQFAIYTWHPRIVINLGTCGGFEGEIARGEIILVDLLPQWIMKYLENEEGLKLND
jgi:adenosylhomocysteine nucleosidase